MHLQKTKKAKIILGRSSWASPESFKTLSSYLTKLTGCFFMCKDSSLWVSNKTNSYKRNFGSPQQAEVYKHVAQLIKRDRKRAYKPNPLNPFS